jgi:hypothetical protein
MKTSTSKAVCARYDVMGRGHDAYADLIKALGGSCKPEIVGWCELDIDGTPRSALVVSQAWPFLPLGVDPKPVIDAKKYVAIVLDSETFRVVEVTPPPPGAIA